MPLYVDQALKRQLCKVQRPSLQLLSSKFSIKHPNSGAVEIQRHWIEMMQNSILYRKYYICLQMYDSDEVNCRHKNKLQTTSVKICPAEGSVLKTTPAAH